MSGLSARATPPPIESRRTIADADPITGSVLNDISRMLWPHKTAAHVAAAANCSVRAVEFYLAGERSWSGDALAAVIQEICKRHQLRNVRVRARR